MFLANLNAWTVIAWMIATAWIAITVVFWRACRNQSLLKPIEQSWKRDAAPRLSVLVAARNESTCIETCIRSLLGQDYPNLEVVAINDRSTDDTAQILDRLAEEFAGQLRVVHVSSLLAGWFGKPHALNLGLQSATGSVVCFTDADCQFQAPSALSTAVAELLRRQLDFFSITARYSMTSLRESLAVPCCSELLMTILRPERVEDPTWPDAFANGAFILVQRSTFEQIGGWGAVRNRISEDLQMARLAKQSGLRVAIAQGAGFYQTDSYGTVRDSWNGWSRIFKGTLTPAQLSIALFRMTFLFVVPLVSTVLGLFVAFRTGSFDGLTQGAGLALAIAYGLRCVLDVKMFRLVGATILATPLAPLGRLFVMACALRALLSHAGLVHTHWRGANFSAGNLVILPTPSEPQIR